MHAVSRGLQKISGVAVGIGMLVLSVNVLIQILGRQVMKISIPWTDEVARFSFIWMAMIAASLMIRQKAHFTVTILADAVPWKRALNIVIDAVIIFVAFCLVYYGHRYTMLGVRKMSSVINMRMIWIYAAIPVSALCMAFYGVEMLLEDLGLLSPAAPAEEETEEGA